LPKGSLNIWCLRNECCFDNRVNINSVGKTTRNIHHGDGMTVASQYVEKVR